MHLLDILSFEIKEMNKCHSGSDLLAASLCDYKHHPPLRIMTPAMVFVTRDTRGLTSPDAHPGVSPHRPVSHSARRAWSGITLGARAVHIR